MPSTSLIIGIVWLIFWVYWFASAFRSKHNAPISLAKWTRRQIPIRILLLVIVLFFLQPRFLTLHFYKNYNSETHSILLEIIGAIIFALGLSVAIWARLYLGKNWGMPMTLKKEPALVTDGPYQYIRHPIYSGILFAIFGTALATNFVLIFGMVILGIYFIFSARIEEKNMLTIFPEKYTDYMKHSKMLIPFIL